jgi:hypothetical protein
MTISLACKGAANATSVAYERCDVPARRTLQWSFRRWRGTTPCADRCGKSKGESLSQGQCL